MMGMKNTPTFFFYAKHTKKSPLYTEGGGGETPQKETSCISWLLKNTMVTIWRDGVHGILR
ncbi:hypothetical protein, partial [Alteribacillus persepolensis]|uniref:hypothetical protein n=1 Tax=Alteribacillus persepolensis TaxID=568899 RepID=UPI001C31C3CD